MQPYSSKCGPRTINVDSNVKTVRNAGFQPYLRSIGSEFVFSQDPQVIPCALDFEKRWSIAGGGHTGFYSQILPHACFYK